MLSAEMITTATVQTPISKTPQAKVVIPASTEELISLLGFGSLQRDYVSKRFGNLSKVKENGVEYIDLVKNKDAILEILEKDFGMSPTDGSSRFLQVMDVSGKNRLSFDEIISALAVIDPEVPSSVETSVFYQELRSKYLYRLYAGSDNRINYQEFRIMALHGHLAKGNQNLSNEQLDTYAKTLAANVKSPESYITEDIFKVIVSSKLIPGIRLLLRAKFTPWSKQHSRTLNNHSTSPQANNSPFQSPQTNQKVGFASPQQNLQRLPNQSFGNHFNVGGMCSSMEIQSPKPVKSFVNNFLHENVPSPMKSPVLKSPTHVNAVRQFQLQLQQEYQSELADMNQEEQKEYLFQLNQELLNQVFGKDSIQSPVRNSNNYCQSPKASNKTKSPGTPTVKLNRSYDGARGFTGRSYSAPHDPIVAVRNSAISPSLIENENDSSHGAELFALRVIQHYLLSQEWKPSADRRYKLLTANEIFIMCEKVNKLLSEEDMCVKVEAPCKVYGDIHGQLLDLLEFFKTYGSPNHHTGDVVDVGYVFLGDFVDRGRYSIDIVVLLFALKIKYPNRIFLIRGNHEDRRINYNYGFYGEIMERFEDEFSAKQLFETINDVFENMPIAGLIAERILCVHGGIGRVERIEQIERIKRPLRYDINNEESLLAFQDILWSDPTEGPSENGIHINPKRGMDIPKFGPDIVLSFIKRNNIDLIIRGHQVVKGGYEFFARGHLLTIFSARDYLNMKNHGAMLHISSELEVKPKVIETKEGEAIEWAENQHAPPSPPRKSISM